MHTDLTIPLWSLLGMVVWTMGLVIAIFLYRNGLISMGVKQPNEFPGGVPHGPEWYWRLNRAHANAVENLPLFATVIIVAHLVQAENATLDGLAVVYVLARIFQSSIHIMANTPTAVRIRSFFFVVQISVIVTYVTLIPLLDMNPTPP